jgi:4-amino-4-deoxy-L-arabinose transferase-like glycosyltransferase
MATPQTHIGPQKGLTIDSKVLFLVFLLLNLALKLPFLTSQPIELDEPFSIFHSQQTLAELIRLFPDENSPPLHYLVLHWVIQLFGIEAWSVRLPSMIFSCLGAALLFRSGERHFGRIAGVTAACMFTICNFHLYHSHEARTYSLLVFLTVLTLDRFLRLVDEPDKTRNYIWLGILNALLIYSHFLGFWLLLAQGVGFFLLGNKNIIWWRLGLSWAGTALLYLPFLFVLLGRVGNYYEEGSWMWQPHWSELYGNINRFLNGIPGTLAVAVVLMMGVVGWLRGSSHSLKLPGWATERKFLLVAMIFGLVYFGMFAASLMNSPIFLDRYLLFTTVPLFLILGKLCDGLFHSKGLKWAASVILLAGMVINLNPNPSNERPITQLVAQIDQLKSSQTPLIICPPFRDLAVLYHLDRASFQDYRNKEARMRNLNIYPIHSSGEITTDISSRSDILFLDADSEYTHPGNGIRKHLQSLFSKEKEYQFGPVYRLFHFQK